MKNIIFATSFVVMCLVGCGSPNTNYETSYDDYEIEEEYDDILVADDELEKRYSETNDLNNSYNVLNTSLSLYTPNVYIAKPISYNSTYHTDSSYRYEYRTGISGNYNYNYDVSGSDYYGDSVSGNLDMQGKYGDGYIINANGDELEVEAEWTDYGVIEATDYYGNSYELIVD